LPTTDRMATDTVIPGPLAPAGAAPAPAARRTRIDSVDLLRGAVMVLMLLDHTREYVHRDGLAFDPTDLSRTTVLLFLTRWVTHFCAPAFVFLAGTGVALQLLRGKSKREISRFLLTRGAWLIFLEFTLVRFVVTFDLDYAAFPGMLQVIWAIGVGMMVLAALIHLRTRWIAMIGIAIVALHNLTDGLNVALAPGATPSAGEALWMVLHQPGFVPVLGVRLLVLYPVLPWIGVLLCGYCLGHVYGWDAERRRRFLVRLGLGMVAAFIVLRLPNLYGNPSDWSAQKNAAFTVLSFINTNKYPPSLLFVLMTLGPALLVLAWVEGARRGPLGRALVTFGRVPLFFYVLQWVMAHGMGLLLSLAAGKPTSHFFGMPGFTPPEAGAGFSLGVAYLCWLAGVALLYPLCRWFAAVKQRRDDWWLSYL
ncbi:MAG TPA: heparan-alpha-glucosaminide N-acetyltransferase domain-containing protein, partial [Longimicrobium sp.]|nr:heparan-alpha-glucosaminide N-acetyltransferase domain-containing protein [Longimicrobium sp.]